MRIKSFSVTNFRSITKAHKIAISDLTVLIGRNNEGKSNILKALNIAMNVLNEHARESARGLRRSRLRRNYSRDEENYYHWKRDFPVNLQSRKSANQSIFRIEFLLTEEEIAEFRQVIRSNLTGTLPLEIKIGPDHIPLIKVAKRGMGSKSLSEKSSRIAAFIANRIIFNYIPAVRTDQQALDVVREMLSEELGVLEEDAEYLAALETIKKLQQPILKALAKKIKDPLQEFIPDIKSVKITIPEIERRYALRRQFNVEIDDGTPTNIEFKGDGIKSLAALGLLKNKYIKGGVSIIAIEEPESHLHPSAIHQLKEIIEELSISSQVIVTSHNPLFADRKNIQSNVIIDSGQARAAKKISEIRDVLGVKASDNLVNANYVLVVEGDEDVVSLKALLPKLSNFISKSINNNLLIIDSMGGAGNLSYKLSMYSGMLCVCHVLLDNDDAGKKAFEKASKSGLLKVRDCTFVNCKGMAQSEFEDTLDVALYEDAIFEEFGVEINKGAFRSNRKWSDRMQAVFQEQGKCWNNEIQVQVKRIVANRVKAAPHSALNEHKRQSIDALVTSLEQRIGANKTN